MSNLSTLGCTEGVISQICDNGNQLLLFAVGSGSGLTLKLLRSIDTANIQCSGKFGLGRVNTSSVDVSCQEHLVQHMRSNEQIRSTGTLIVLSCIQNCIDHGLCDDIVLTKVSRSIGSLKLFLGSCDIKIDMNGVQIVVQPNRSDVIP